MKYTIDNEYTIEADGVEVWDNGTLALRGRGAIVALFARDAWDIVIREPAIEKMDTIRVDVNGKLVNE